MSRQATRQAGFTLVETMTTLTLAATLLAGGVPAFSQVIAANRLATETNAMLTHLHLARSEAVLRGVRTVLCASADGDTCQTGSQWSSGYLVFADLDGDKERDADEPVLRTHQVRTGVRVLTSAGRKTVTYQPSGMSPGSNLTITFCDAGHHAAPRAVIVAQTGRPREDQTHADGTPLSCAG